MFYLRKYATDQIDLNLAQDSKPNVVRKKKIISFQYNPLLYMKLLTERHVFLKMLYRAQEFVSNI
jgi:hypothetical protein